MSHQELLDFWVTSYEIEVIQSLEPAFCDTLGSQARRIVHMEFGSKERYTAFEHAEDVHGDHFERKNLVAFRKAISDVIERPHKDFSGRAKNGALIRMALTDGGDFVMLAICANVYGGLITSYPVSARRFKRLMKQHLKLKNAAGEEESGESFFPTSSGAHMSLVSRWDPSSTRPANGKCLPGEVNQRVWMVVADYHPLRVADPGEAVFEVEVFCDELQLSQALLDAFEGISDSYWKAFGGMIGLEGRQAAIFKATMDLKAFICGYRLRQETGEPVYVKFEGVLVQVRGSNVRIAEKVIWNRLCAAGSRFLEDHLAQDLETLDLSSSHCGHSLSWPKL